MQFCSGRRHGLVSLIYSGKKTNMNFRSIHSNAATPFLPVLAPRNSFYARGIRLWQAAVLMILRVIALTQIFYAVIKGVVVDVVYGVRGCSVMVSPHKSMRSVQDIINANLVVMMRSCTCKRSSQAPSFSLPPVQTSICVGKQCLQALFGKVAISSVHGVSNHVPALYNTGTRPFA